MSWKFKYYNIDTGVDWVGIERDFDWFRDMVNVEQHSIHHAEGNVQIHTKMVVEVLQTLSGFKKLSELNKHKMVTSALFHDIEKRSTSTPAPTKDSNVLIIWTPRHAQVGEYTTRQVLYKDLNVPFEIREEICSMVRFHGAPLWAIEDDDIHLKILRISERCNIELLSLLATADVMGRTCTDKDELLEKLEYFKEIAMENSCYYGSKRFESNIQRYTTLNDVYYNPHTCHTPFDNSKFHVHMLSGIAGSGKDTYIKNNLPDIEVVSLDDLRRKFKVKPTDKKRNGVIIQIAKERCKELMREHKDFIFNGTNITAELRGKWLNLFSEYGGKTTIHYIEVPYSTLIKQNSNREHKVPDEIIEKMIRKLEIPKYREAFNIIFYTPN